MTSPVLQIANVSKSFGGLQVIDDVSFEVASHSKTGLIGPNGAGKTTIFNLISGVYGVDQGSISVAGADLTHMPSRHRIRQGIARNFQNVRLMPHLSVLENLLLGQHPRADKLTDLLTPFRFRKNHRWLQEAQAALAATGLDTYADATVSALPYGVRKRVDLVRATLTNPRLLMLDEPAAGLNTAEMDALAQDIEALSSRGLALLIVEHDMSFVSRLCDQIIVLNFGKKIAEGDMATVRENAAVREAYLGGEPEVDHVA